MAVFWEFWGSSGVYLTLAWAISGALYLYAGHLHWTLVCLLYLEPGDALYEAVKQRRTPWWLYSSFVVTYPLWILVGKVLGAKRERRRAPATCNNIDNKSVEL